MMTWGDVAAKIKFWGPDVTPSVVNGVKAAGYGGAFGQQDKLDILRVLQVYYERLWASRN